MVGKSYPIAASLDYVFMWVGAKVGPPHLVYAGSHIILRGTISRGGDLAPENKREWGFEGKHNQNYYSEWHILRVGITYWNQKAVSCRYLAKWGMTEESNGREFWGPVHFFATHLSQVMKIEHRGKVGKSKLDLGGGKPTIKPEANGKTRLEGRRAFSQRDMNENWRSVRDLLTL
ncbi:hypothetical protein Tco_1302328 [Tanacetum coccineum]